MADSCASGAEDWRSRGENGRAIDLFDCALEFQVAAIALAIEEGGSNAEELEALCERAIGYAEQCGRLQKAKQLRRMVELHKEPEGHSESSM